MPASQDFRDGAATGAHVMADRINRLIGYGITMTPAVVNALATNFTEEMGGISQAENF